MQILILLHCIQTYWWNIQSEKGQLILSKDQTDVTICQFIWQQVSVQHIFKKLFSASKWEYNYNVINGSDEWQLLTDTLFNLSLNSKSV